MQYDLHYTFFLEIAFLLMFTLSCTVLQGLLQESTPLQKISKQILRTLEFPFCTAASPTREGAVWWTTWTSIAIGRQRLQRFDASMCKWYRYGISFSAPQPGPQPGRANVQKAHFSQRSELAALHLFSILSIPQEEDGT